MDSSKLKAFADDKIMVTKMFGLDLDRVENIVGKGENAGNKHFLLFPQCFQKASIEVIKITDCLVKGNLLPYDKRAMMALDCSPESFSPQMNSTSLFQLVTPGVWPVLIPRGII